MRMRWPGSKDECEPTSMSRTPGRMPMAMAAAAPAMKPSTTTGDAQRRATEHQARHRAELRPADFGQYVHRVCGIGAVAFNALPDEFGLMPDTFGWDAGADARDPFNWCSGQHSGNRRGRRGVANAHFSGGQQGDTFFSLLHGPCRCPPARRPALLLESWRGLH